MVILFTAEIPAHPKLQLVIPIDDRARDDELDDLAFFQVVLVVKILQEAVQVRWTVDAYAAQHPGKPEPRTIQSINVHLLALYLLIERNQDPAFATKIMGKVAETKKGRLDWLVPPPRLGEITVIDVARASNPSEHAEIVKAWAESVWTAWKPNHGAIERLVKEFV